MNKYFYVLPFLLISSLGHADRSAMQNCLHLADNVIKDSSQCSDDLWTQAQTCLMENTCNNAGSDDANDAIGLSSQCTANITYVINTCAVNGMAKDSSLLPPPPPSLNNTSSSNTDTDTTSNPVASTQPNTMIAPSSTTHIQPFSFK